ncbi:hypothetical protein COO60DRAFT_1697665 [Scenedesmus sp. NREL 46B-D3]|nr:hypothetical protein COO60DRAFT_1697665 [Scenedesmus sp. NREL 46B-D3]
MPRDHEYHPPIICYDIDNLPPVNTDLLERLAHNSHELIQELIIPPRDGLAWEVKAGQVFRIVCTEGPQVADVNFWSLHNPKERFYASKTRQLHASHLKTHDRLWSCFPYMRPLASITYETIQYGIDKDGASVHDVIGSRCDPYTNWLLTGQDMNVCCHSNLTRAVAPFGLREDDVHDVLNAFMCTGFTRNSNQYFTKPSPVRVGDYIEFLAETDLLVAASTCPQGDVSVACGTGKAPQCYPLGVQIFQPTAEMLQGWKPSEPVQYGGGHGMSQQQQQQQQQQEQPDVLG